MALFFGAPADAEIMLMECRLEKFDTILSITKSMAFPIFKILLDLKLSKHVRFWGHPISSMK